MDITTHVENLPLKAKLLRVTVYKYIHYMSYTCTLAPHVVCRVLTKLLLYILFCLKPGAWFTEVCCASNQLPFQKLNAIKFQHL